MNQNTIIPYVVTFLATRENFESRTKDIITHLLETLKLNDNDLKMTESATGSILNSRIGRMVRNLVSHRIFEKLGIGKVTNTGLKLNEDVGYSARRFCI